MANRSSSLAAKGGTSSPLESSSLFLKQQIAKEKVKSDNNTGGVSSKQALVYFAIVIACFVVVYPRMIHPMLKLALGFGGQDSTSNSQHPNPEHPPHRGKPAPGSSHGMRPPPGARGDHANADAGKSSSGGGVMGMILPIYAGGLFLYLLYAASKAYKSDGSSNRRRDPQEETYALITERLAGLDLEKIVSGEDKKGASEINKLAEFLRQKNSGIDIHPDCLDEMEEEDSMTESVEVLENVTSKQTSKSPPRNSSLSDTTGNPMSVDDTDELLRKCESHESMTEEEMLRLKIHLSQMEGRMNKLMSALHSVQSKTADVAAGVSDMAAEEEVENLSDGLDDVSSMDNDSVTEADRLEVQEVYDEIGSGSEEETAADGNDVESGGVRKRRFEVEDCSDEENV